MLNTEIVGYKNGNLWMLASPEVTPMLNDQLAASTDLTLTRNSTPPTVIGQPWCWNDQWTFTAAGVPSVSFWSQDNDYSGVYKTTIYHTQYDTPALINYPFLGDISKFEFRVAKKFDRGLLPYTLAARGARTCVPRSAAPRRRRHHADRRDVIEKYVDGDAYDDFTARRRSLRRRRRHVRRGTPRTVTSPAANQPAINAQLMQIEKLDQRQLHRARLAGQHRRTRSTRSRATSTA